MWQGNGFVAISECWTFYLHFQTGSVFQKGGVIENGKLNTNACKCVCLMHAQFSFSFRMVGNESV